MFFLGIADDVMENIEELGGINKQDFLEIAKRLKHLDDPFPVMQVTDMLVDFSQNTCWVAMILLTIHDDNDEGVHALNLNESAATMSKTTSYDEIVEYIASELD